MVPEKRLVPENFLLDLEISKAFLISLEVSFCMVCSTFFESQNFLPRSLGLRFLKISVSQLHPYCSPMTTDISYTSIFDSQWINL